VDSRDWSASLPSIGVSVLARAVGVVWLLFAALLARSRLAISSFRRACNGATFTGASVGSR
jgi:hypothetical protein